MIELTEFGRHAQPGERTERTRRGSIRFSRLRSEAVSCDVCRPKERVWREPNTNLTNLPTPPLALRPRRRERGWAEGGVRVCVSTMSGRGARWQYKGSTSLPLSGRLWARAVSGAGNRSGGDRGGGGGEVWRRTKELRQAAALNSELWQTAD